MQIVNKAKVIFKNLKMIEQCKANAAKYAVDDNITVSLDKLHFVTSTHMKRDCVVGIGSGSTMRYVLEHLEHVCKEKGLSVKCIPTSFQSKQLIYEYNLPITELDAHPVIDITIDGADEVDENFVAIKGGGACLAQEKVVAFAAKRFVVVADYRKNSKQLGQSWTKGIPIEVLPMASNVVRHKICNQFNSSLDDIVIRNGQEKAGPVITDNGNFVIDWRFKPADNRSSADWSSLSDQVKLIPGVVETGIFANIIKSAYFGQEDGTVLKKTP